MQRRTFQDVVLDTNGLDHQGVADLVLARTGFPGR